MFTLRCTQKLLRRMPTPPFDAASPPATLLGDWYANILFSRPRQLVLCLSERTLLPVIVPAKSLETLPARLADGVVELLHALGIPPELIARERAAMDEAHMGRTASRRVLGSMNDLQFQLECAPQANPERALRDHALWLARTPMKPIEYSSPDAATHALFQASLALDTVRARRAP